MPQLISFLPCEKVIIANDGALSLIGVLDTLTASVPPGGTIAPASVAPIRWSILTVFKREPGDEGKNYIQRIRFILPNGEVGGEAVTHFHLGHPMARNISGGEGFPVGLAGECRLQLTLAEGENREEVIIAEYPVAIAHRSG